MVTRDTILFPMSNILLLLQKDAKYPLNKTLQFTVTSRRSIRRNNDLSHESPPVTTLLAGWTPKTLSGFGNYINKWLKYGSDNNISDPFQETYKDLFIYLLIIIFRRIQLLVHILIQFD